MSDHDKKPEEKHGLAALGANIANAFQEGLMSLFDQAGTQPLKKIHFMDPVKAIVKTVAGSFAMAEGKTEIEIEFDGEAQGTLAEARRIKAQLEGEADKIEAEALAAAEHESGDEKKPPTKKHQLVVLAPTQRKKNNRRRW